MYNYLIETYFKKSLTIGWISQISWNIDKNKLNYISKNITAVVEQLQQIYL